MLMVNGSNFMILIVDVSLKISLRRVARWDLLKERNGHAAVPSMALLIMRY